ncbi:hypothetical protein [Methanothrix sp.]|uniref:hypothetical protein n=1 Tax=Methanothrix sp. TaxID=90426 RepID=UPI003BB6D607
MIERALSDRTSPKTQSIDAVKALLAWKKVSRDPLPEVREGFPLQPDAVFQQ